MADKMVASEEQDDYETMGQDFPMPEIMDHIFNASNEQLHIALDLTRLIVEHAGKPMSKEEILSTYEECLSSVEEIAPVERLLENLPE